MVFLQGPIIYYLVRNDELLDPSPLEVSVNFFLLVFFLGHLQFYAYCHSNVEGGSRACDVYTKVAHVCCS